MDFVENWKLFCGDALETLRQMEDASVDCCVTSPPYYALRDYGYEGQIGLEDTPEEFIKKLVAVFREVRRVLKPSGTCWINIGDSYWGSGSRGFDFTNTITEKSKLQMNSKGTMNLSSLPQLKGNAGKYKDKDLIGIPWMLAFALRTDGWYLRQDIVWSKPNCMPESIKDRCTKSHEYIFLLTKEPRYYFDNKAIQEEAAYPFDNRGERTDSRRGTYMNSVSGSTGEFRNKRDVWVVPTSGGYSDGGAHYATFNPKLIEPCVLAGCPQGGVVLDPFNGTGTTGVVAIKASRKYVGIDLSKKYIEMSTRRLERESAQYNLFDQFMEDV